MWPEQENLEKCSHPTPTVKYQLILLCLWYTAIPTPLKSSSVPTPTLASWLWNLLLLQALLPFGLSTVSQSTVLWLWSSFLQKSMASQHPKKALQIPASASSEVPCYDPALSFQQHLWLLVSRNINCTHLCHAFPPFPASAVPLAHNNLVIVLYLWHLSFKVLGSARRTPRHGVFYNPSCYLFPPFLSISSTIPVPLALALATICYVWC